jgi:hypothetical protein
MKFIFLVSKIHKFGGQKSRIEASMRATLEREETTADIQHQISYHVAE